MNSTIAQKRPIGRFAEHSALPPSEQKRGWRSRLLAALTRLGRNGADHGEAAFYRIEYGHRGGAPLFTTARDEQLRIELLGPPPLGL